MQFSSEGRLATFANREQMLNQRLCFGQFAFQFRWKGTSLCSWRCTNTRKIATLQLCMHRSHAREIDLTRRMLHGSSQTQWRANSSEPGQAPRFALRTTNSHVKE